MTYSIKNFLIFLNLASIEQLIQEDTAIIEPLFVHRQGPFLSQLKDPEFIQVLDFFDSFSNKSDNFHINDKDTLSKKNLIINLVQQERLKDFSHETLKRMYDISPREDILVLLENKILQKNINNSNNKNKSHKI